MRSRPKPEAGPQIQTGLLGQGRIERLEQLEDNLSALDFELPVDQVATLDKVSAPEPPRPYLMFSDAVFEQFLTPGMRVRSLPEWTPAS